ncbi:IS5 family transposase [Reinekea sp. G2M2-21]|uniref:IS5 family transposase n=1 Tax=Reinekea sp. G2M2-21 TaxID=2788942 RepID=UPI0018ABE3A6|nr:IS5 family transposase [Reinekea sp. G2M2-21]
MTQHLEKKGLSYKEGTIIDASTISALTSTKKTGQRDHEIHQTMKGNEWHFGMKMHIDVDDVLGLIHSLKTTSANLHDIVVSGQLLHGKEKRVSGEAGYLGLDKRSEHEHREVDWLINQPPDKRKSMSSDELKIETIKSSLRAQVEHCFARIKQQFGYSKVRYRGLQKNTNWLYLLAGLTTNSE